MAGADALSAPAFYDLGLAMGADYPLLLKPHLAKRVWGGTLLGDGVGEAWDLSVHPNGPSTITNGALAGRSLAEVAAGSADDFGGPIDLLAKRLDCAQDLSIQVHPKSGDPKTEAWVVLQAEPGAGVYHGWSREVDEEQACTAALDGSLPRLLRFLEVTPGRAVFIPSGTVHAIGAGLLLFELQQSADTTYRLFDWGRGRELHLAQGLGCADWTNSEALPAACPPDGEGAARLIGCEHFFIDRLDSKRPSAIRPGRRWSAVLLIAGSARIGEIALEAGATLLVPRAAGPRTLVPSPACTALVYGPGPG